MAVVTMLQNNFVGGEIPPSLQSRSDLAIYYKALAKAENFIITKEGTLKKRRGITAINTIPSEVGSIRHIPYRYNRTEWGVLTFNYVGGTLSAFLVGPDGVAGEPTAVYTGAITSSEIAAIRAEQIGDTFFCTSQGVFNKLIVVGYENKSLTVKDYTQSDRPKTVSKITAVVYTGTGTPTTSSGRTYTYAAYVCKGGVLSEAKSVNVKLDTSWPAGYYILVTVTHGLDIEANDYDYVLIGKKQGSFFGEVARFYPGDITTTTVTFKDENIAPGEVIYTQTNILGSVFKAPVVVNAFQQRLVFANANQDGVEMPMTLWFSEIGNLYNFYSDRPVSDDDPFSVTLHSTGPSFIRWLCPYQRAIIAFTDAGIFAIAGSQNEGFSSSTVQINKLSNMAVSTRVKPIETDSGLIFVGADNKTLYSMAYDVQTDSTKPTSQMFFAKHLTRNAEITSIALQQYPDTVIWAALSDGTFLSFTFEEAQQVYAWSRHKIDGAKVVEVLGPGTVTDGANDYTYGDIIFVIEHEDGHYHFAKFSDGYMDISHEGIATAVVATAETLKLESNQETIKFAKKTIKDVMIDFVESGALEVTPAPQDNLPAEVINKTATNDSLFTGSAKVMPRGTISETGKMELISNTATPCEILGLTYKVDVH